MITPGTVVRHKKVHVFETGSHLFDGPGTVTECHGNLFAKVVWQTSLVTAFHQVEHLEVVGEPDEVQ